MYDCHTHSRNSHDSTSKFIQTCEFAINYGMLGVALTDHCDYMDSKKTDFKKTIGNSVNECLSVREMLGERIDVFTGIELAESIENQDFAKDMLNSFQFDTVIGSVHTARHEKYLYPYSRIDFSMMSKETLYEYLEIYFNDCLETAKYSDIDILAHLTCPYRYIFGKYNLNIDTSRFDEIIEKILNTIIDREIALEINTSNIGTNYNEYMPCEDIIYKYIKFGGRLITLGSDTHNSKSCGNGFIKAISVLKKYGCEDLYYYKNRKPYKYKAERNI